MSVPVHFFRNETAAMAAHRTRLEENVIESYGVEKEAPGIRVRAESKGLHLCGKAIRDTRKEGERRQVIGVLLEQTAGPITLEANVIDARMQVEDRRKQSR